MQVFLVICDAAQVEESTGKISMLGGDWAVTSPGNPGMSLVVFLRVSWQEIEQSRSFTLRLLDEHQQPVVAPIKGEKRPVQFTGQLSLNENSPVADDPAAHLVDVHSSFTVNAPGIGGVLTPGSVYTWSFLVEDTEVASVKFAVRTHPDDGEADPPE